MTFLTILACDYKKKRGKFQIVLITFLFSIICHPPSKYESDEFFTVLQTVKDTAS